MLDFTRVLYLGLRHPARSLPSWSSFTWGVPAALEEPVEAQRTAQRLADLQGCASGVLAPSTLHLFWDLFGVLSRQPSIIYVDASVYPIGRWGAEHAASRGAVIQTFPHQDAVALQEMMDHHPFGRAAIILTDGVNTCCGDPAPLREYLAVLPSTGWLVVDDTQALGLLGSWPSLHAPYGSGGGGSLHFHGLQDERIILISSMAKGFGVPAAVLSSSKEWIEHYKIYSETRMHCSPVSSPSILAARRALVLNQDHGDRLRRQLAQRVRQFRNNLESQGLRAKGGLFPVQTIRLPGPMSAVKVHQRLQESGIDTVVRRCNHERKPCLSFVITAQHTPAQIDQAVASLASILE